MYARLSMLQKLALLHWPLFWLIMLMSGLGMLMLYSASGGAMDPYTSSQLTKFVPGLVMMLIIAIMPVRLVKWLAYPAYAACILLLLWVEVAGHQGMGAQRWIAIGGFQLQPSEFTKLAVILVLAHYFHTLHPNEKPSPLYLIPPLLLIALPVALILKQPNLGTATIMCAISIMMLFVAGVRWIYFIGAGSALLISAPIGWQFLHAYQKQRVLTFLNPEADPQGAGYNILQSMIAIGSGGVSGKGYLQGSQGQLDFLPEKQTDFIFTMLAEEFGFIGAAGVIALYVLLIVLILAVGLRSQHRFGSLVASGIAGMLFVHLFINVGMVMGLLPVVGVPLPLFSYGGTILLASLMGLGLVLNTWVYRKERLP